MEVNKKQLAGHFRCEYPVPSVNWQEQECPFCEVVRKGNELFMTLPPS